MKIALVVDDSLDPSDGVQQYVLTIGGWLSEQGNDVHYITSTTSRNIPNLHVLSKNLRVGFNKNKLGIPLPASKRAIKQLLAKEKFDVVHVQMPFSPLLSGRLIKQLPAQTALVGTFHVAPFSQTQQVAGRMLRAMTRTTIKRFDEVVSVSKVAQSYAQTVFNIHSTVVPNAVNVRNFISDHTPIANRIVFLGRLVERKGCRELLKVACELKAQQVEFELLIVGDGPQRKQLETFVVRNDLQNHVTFKGYVSEEEKRDLLASATMAIFPALGGESFGIVIIEALAAGSDVVLAANNPGYSSVLESVPESLIDIKDAKATAERIKEIIGDKYIRRDISFKQGELLKHFSVLTVGKQIMQCYEMAIEKRLAKVHNKR